jgi:hypothetical protein
LPPAPVSENEVGKVFQIKVVPPEYVYIHTVLPNSEVFNVDVYGKDTKRNTDYIPDLLTNARTSTG